MEIDVLIVSTPQQARASVLTLGSVVLDCDVDCTVSVLMHGGTRADFADLDEFLATMEVFNGNPDKPIKKQFRWRARHEKKAMSFGKGLELVSEMMTKPLAVLVQPGLIVNDPKWFGKMQQTFLKDPRNMITVADVFKNIHLPPRRMTNSAQIKSPLIMGGVDLPKICQHCLSGEENFARDLRFTTKQLGGNRWVLDSVRYTFLHESCQEPEPSDRQANLFE